MIMDEHLAPSGDAGEGEHRANPATRHHARRVDHPAIVEATDEADFLSAGESNRSTHTGRGSVRHPRCRRCHWHDGTYRLDREESMSVERPSQVFSGFFFAAGKSTLFRISR